MRDYTINTDKMVNQLTPHYLGGRKMMLFLQSLVYPLQPLSDKWGKWSHDIYQEAAMTSQVFLFEHFLNDRLAEYLQNPRDKIKILDTDIHGVVIYWKNVEARHSGVPMRMMSEGKKNTLYLYRKTGPQQYTGISFVIKCPAINISQEQMTFKIKKFADRYHITGKKYKIEYN